MAMTAPNQHGAALDNRGFTLVELLMVIAHHRGFVYYGHPCLFQIYETLAKNARCKSEIRTVEKSIIAYNLDNGKYPNALDATCDHNP